VQVDPSVTGSSSSTNWLTTAAELGTVVFNQSVEEGCVVSNDQLSRVFSALADPTRRDMIATLASADATLVDLAAPHAMSVQAVSKHLQVLEEAGLVSRTRDAQRRPAHLEVEVFDLMIKWIERYRREAAERFERLDELLAERTASSNTRDTPTTVEHTSKGPSA
jgi:DNA-binding transcriptional ArsR family regulator